MEAAPYKEEACVVREKVEWHSHRSCGDMAEPHVARIVEQEEVEYVVVFAEGHIVEVDSTI